MDRCRVPITLGTFRCGAVIGFGMKVWTNERCDNPDGPCACGSWHSEDSPPAYICEKGHVQ